MHGMLISFQRRSTCCKVTVRHSRNEPVGPVKILCGNLLPGVGHIGRHPVYIGVEGNHRIEYIGTHGNPLNIADAFRKISPDLRQCKDIVPVDANGPVCSAHTVRPMLSVWVKRRSLIMV